MTYRDISARIVTAAATLLVSASLCGVTAPCALAEEAADLQAQDAELAAKVEQTTSEYQQAQEQVNQIEEQIAQTEQRGAELEAELPVQRARTAASVKSLYLFQQSTTSLLEIILSAEDFDDFLSTMRYMDAIHTRNTTEIRALADLEDELTRTQAMLESERDEAQKREQDAQAALGEALDARMELQARALAIALQESGAREDAVAVARQALEATDGTFVTNSGYTTEVAVPTQASVDTQPLVTNTTSQESGDWAARIDAYLAGSPLEGYGSVFADAAATYGVDPRLSPAIATIESGKGSACFNSYNAWGWGNSSWNSWEDAIYDQVKGLANGYGGTLTIEGAQRYCPPNADLWYSSVGAQMDSI